MSANSQNFREIGLTNIFLKEKSRIFALGSVFCGGGDGHGGGAKEKPNPTNYLEYLEHLEYREYLEYQGSFAIFAMFYYIFKLYCIVCHLPFAICHL